MHAQVSDHDFMMRVLRSVIDAPALARDIQLGAYVSMLKRTDWSGDLAEVRMLRRELDPSGSLWRQHAPQGVL